MENYLFTVEITKENEVEIHLNEKGLLMLKNSLEFLLRNNVNEHLHFLTEKMGGDQLSSEKQNYVSNLVDHLSVVFWKT